MKCPKCRTENHADCTSMRCPMRPLKNEEVFTEQYPTSNEIIANCPYDSEKEKQAWYTGVIWMKEKIGKI